MYPVSIVIPTWNGAGRLKRILPLLARQTYPIREILVADNGSVDDSVAVAEEQGARVIQLNENRGFSVAVNLGIGASGSPLVAVVNNDVEPEPDWLEALVRAFDNPDVSFATGKILSLAQPDRIDGTFDVICRGGCAWRAGHGRPDGPDWQSPRRIAFAPWTAAVFRRSLFDEVGLLEESFESYLEDVDFGLRCALLGKSGAYVPEAVCYHQGSMTLGVWHPDTVRRIARNQVWLLARHYPSAVLGRWLWQILVAQILWGFVAARHGGAAGYLRGKWEGILQFGRMRRAFEPAQGTGESLAQILLTGEEEIREIQQRTGFDLFWRLYFALT